ncbi:transcription factor LHW-like [Malania oleifera]|uniref:transcription factor LHW-like n=1 Tax=Malania oleifera TaxID=397392 RepID=UPI0025AE36C7|nr:transcription factor LHW-like [Malania oleifera]
MGFLLKEVLKTLCGSNQWSYAVFWKIGHQNPKLLIWEECHYEVIPCSFAPLIPGFESSRLPLEEWEPCCVAAETHTPRPGIQAANNVHLLVEKMMMNNQVIVVGEGIVGRAVFTGNHQWILSENYITDAHSREVLNELQHQFSAGMQTVAVIPVLPHGVVQLGSSFAIVENLGFLNDVKSLIRLASVPDALLSDNHKIVESNPNISLGTSISIEASGDYKVTNSAPFMGNSCNQRGNSLLGSRQVHGGQFSDFLIRQIQENHKDGSVQTPNPTQTLAASHDSHCHSKNKPVIKQNHPFKNKLKNGIPGVGVITANPDTWLDQQTSSYNSRSVVNNQPDVGQSSADDSGLRFMAQGMLDDGVRNHVNNNLSTSTSFIKSYLSAGRGMLPNSYGSLGTTQVHEGSEFIDGMSNYPRPLSAPCSLLNPHGSTDVNFSCTHLDGIEIQNSNSATTEVVHASSMSNHLTACHLPSGGSNSRHPSADEMQNQIELSPGKSLVQNDLFQAFNTPLSHADDYKILNGPKPGPLHEFLSHKKQTHGANSRRDVYKNACVSPSAGDDLIDVLGVDFKKKLLSGDWNHIPHNETNVNTGNLGKKTCAPVNLNLKDAYSDPCLVSQGISESGIFSGTGTDHLLDAVVSSVHSASKQHSDDTISCKTTLKKISGSSIPRTSPSYGQVAMSNNMQGELFGLQKALDKAGAGGSNSFISSCSQDGVGNSSQTNSMYGSQMSSWVEQGHNLKRDSSVSTAYSKKPDEVSKPNRKRLKPGENPRPRPKDRQMIQDRVKELREIVPNGAKCSIDALLERTIKHMLFLQSVTKHADKLQQTGESEIISKEGGLLLKDNFEGGATWAFEVGSQSMVCPIIVEDLNPPRQMLVEILCEERGFFLEIADIIRGLGLTILKGVMEVRNDKIWARFAVEANRDVTRVEIFISLVRLLDQTVKSSPLSANGIVDNENMMVHHSFHQAVSIPATGRTSSFQ